MNTTPILQLEFEAELETAAIQQEVEQMEPGLGHAIGQAWQNLPQTTKEWIKVQLRLALQDTLRGRPQDAVRRTIAILLPQLYPTALQMAIETQSVAQLQARIRQLVRATPIPPALLERRKGMTREQIRQYERRQRARGRTPGRNRAPGRGRWRESEIDSATTALEFELAVPSSRAEDLEIASAELANELAADESGAEQTEQESVGTISSSDYLKWVQRSLNRLYGIRIPTAGAISTSYREAVRKFNQDYTGRGYDGVDEQTQNQIIYANEGTGSYVAWLIHALNAAGVGPLAITETYTPGVVAAIKKFQARPGLGIKADGYVGSKTELALVKASGLLPPGEVKKKPVPRRFDRRKLAKKLLDLSGEISRSGGNTIREKRILCIIRLLTSHLVDGERIDDCFVDTSPPFGKLRCRERVLTRLSRRNLDESSARFRKGIFDLYEEIKRPLERTKLALIKISFDTTEDALVNTPECTFVRFFKKKAGDPKSIYRCFAAYIASFGSQCDLP